MNGEYIERIIRDEDGKFFINRMEEPDFIVDEILTREQYEANVYRIGE